MVEGGRGGTHHTALPLTNERSPNFQVATVIMTAGVGFVALLTGALAQRFLYGKNEGVAPDPAASEDEISRKFDDLSRQISEIQEALRERHE